MSIHDTLKQWALNLKQMIRKRGVYGYNLVRKGTILHKLEQYDKQASIVTINREGKMKVAFSEDDLDRQTLMSTLGT